MLLNFMLKPRSELHEQAEVLRTWALEALGKASMVLLLGLAPKSPQKGAACFCCNLIINVWKDDQLTRAFCPECFAKQVCFINEWTPGV